VSCQRTIVAATLATRIEPAMVAVITEELVALTPGRHVPDGF
jgi:hypothetical protein